MISPAPWERRTVHADRYGRDGRTTRVERYVRDANGGSVATIIGSTSDAILIEAAPAMLAALELALDWLESTGADGSPLPAVRKAVAQARGIE